MEPKFNKNDYEPFNDYKDIMIQAFGIACSWCGDPSITYVRKNHPETIGNLVKKYDGKLSDEELDMKLIKPIDEWQTFDDHNTDNGIPTYLCDECYNSFTE
ncbi:hypothetical protein [Mesoplasma lactucae]|uniref:Uncharacterized protein n=1 Tax=Mesoplasma lactucae ATCC 49193 TaxID=81460 RepID=A0A291IQW1_9MOLU|nr:hypothetical protein [Mesoplasma lactucae]ATG97325.1 hypothetical protein CP520_00950 [Mesoplasma lactucae ATCC 49193]ATZ20224.1 hypothetical protein MLACT_v1c04030 [Mesoplasma lactucae ATCC 49193]MCL8216973.1 hypothetical protein [Mesoplasma lactucae ATCC 49193]